MSFSEEMKPMPFLQAAKTNILAKVQRQAAIHKVLMVLPGNYSYERVDRALSEAQMEPGTLYDLLASGQESEMLDVFHKELGT